MPVFDVFTQERIKLKGDTTPTELWRLRTVAASSEEELFRLIADLKLTGTFRVYEQGNVMVVRATRIEVYETERLR